MTPMAPLVPPALSRVGQTFHIAQLSVFCKKREKKIKIWPHHQASMNENM